MHIKQTPVFAFTLIEMSIVIIIIGLLIGGIVVGSSMSENSERQQIMAQKEEYVAAITQFKTKYLGLPGDLYNATSFWPEDTTGTDKWGDSTGSEVENGNGDGKIAGTLAADGYESHRAWRQMALAELIKGEYTGQYESSGTVIVTPGTRVPLAAYSKELVGWHLNYVGSISTTSQGFFNGQYGHILYIGASAFGAGTSTGKMPGDYILALDTKFDDGSPETGSVRSGIAGGVWGGVGCVTGSTPNSAYNESDQTCVPIFLSGIN